MCSQLVLDGVYWASAQPPKSGNPFSIPPILECHRALSKSFGMALRSFSGRNRVLIHYTMLDHQVSQPKTSTKDGTAGTTRLKRRSFSGVPQRSISEGHRALSKSRPKERSGMDLRSFSGGRLEAVGRGRRWLEGSSGCGWKQSTADGGGRRLEGSGGCGLRQSTAGSGGCGWR